ncbi:MAG TPA: FAD binding domain-containing protein [Xanthobacteraceae bacterium]|jgi:carbon-monoxide dehydrogenase medium subunit
MNGNALELDRTYGPVKPAAFAYHAPRTVEEAVAQLAEFAPLDGRVLAGGQSLVPMMAFRMARPAHLIDINGVEGLDRLAIDGHVLTISACVRHAAFHHPAAPGPTGALLSAVAANIAHYPIRMRGTFCGSLANADPASEWCLTAVTLDAELVAVSQRGRRTIAAANFFTGMMGTALGEDELLLEARVPLLPADARFGFYEFSRRAGDYALAMALTVYRLEGGAIAEPRIGIGGAEGHPRRIAQAEAVLVGKKPGEEIFRAAAAIAAEAIEPMEDAHADAAFRRDLVRAVTQRALERTLR